MRNAWIVEELPDLYKMLPAVCRQEQCAHDDEPWYMVHGIVWTETD